MYIKNPEYFITTVREGSISKAAEKLYLSQPYLSPVSYTHLISALSALLKLTSLDSRIMTT